MVGSKEDVDWMKEIVHGNDPAIDIVVVHGLNPSSKASHAENTWKADNKLWLTEFLPDRIPNARILLFSYNSKVTIGANLMGIDEHARKLLLRLQGQRSGDPNRPLLFVAHSLGGIVVKRALVEAKLDSMYENIRQSTHGLAFFGTPHRGGNHGDVVEIAINVVRTVLRSPKNNLLHDLRNKSESLNTLSDDFRHQLEDYKMLSFYETKPVTKGGINHVIVDKQSAYFGLGGGRERIVPLNSDHSEICKFSDRRLGDYVLVETLLSEMAEEAIRVIGKKNSPPPLNSSVSSPELGFRSQFDVNRVQSQPQPPDPVFQVPNSNVRNFVGRRDILKQLEDHLLMPSSEVQPRAALYGLGGVGKTQIAKRLASQIHKYDPDMSVFWIDASSAEVFHQSIVRLVRVLNIPGVDHPRADVMNLFRDWVNGGRCGKWLMIIDQLDDTKALRESLREDAKTKMYLDHLKDADLIPDHPNGAILITTRDKKVAIYTDCGKSIPVGPFEEQEAVELVQLTLKQGDRSEEHDEATLKSLVEILDRFPEAIDRAVKYVLENMIDIPTYLEKFQNKDDTFLRLNAYSETPEGENRYRDASNTTWLISFEKLKETNSDSVDLLFLMAYLDRNNIPETILCQHKQNFPPQRFTEACGRLKAFSLLEEAKVGNTKVFTVPRMVQYYVQSWLRSYNEETKWINQAIAALVEVLPSPDGQNWNSIEGYAQHVTAVLSHLPNPLPESELLATLLHRFSVYHRILGYHTSAEAYGRQALEIRKEILGDKDLATISSTTNVSRILLELNQLPEAEALQEPVAEVCLKTLGLQSRETIDAVRHLAAIRGIQERYKEAEQLELQIVEASKSHFGLGVDTYLAMRDLAVTYSFQERQDEAEELQCTVYEGLKEVSGDRHPDTLIVMSDLATTYAFQRRFKDAENLFRQITDRSKEILGHEHPHTKSAFRNLESMLNFQQLRKDPADLKRWQSLNRQGSSRRKRPQRTPLAATERSMSDSITTYRKASLVYEGALIEDPGSVEANSHQEDGGDLVDESVKVSDKIVEFGRVLQMSWNNMRTSISPPGVKETEENQEAKNEPQFNTNIFQMPGSERSMGLQIEAQTENTTERQLIRLGGDGAYPNSIQENEEPPENTTNPQINEDGNAKQDGLSEIDRKETRTSDTDPLRSKFEQRWVNFKEEEGAKILKKGVGIYGKTKDLMWKKSKKDVGSESNLD